MSDNYPTYNNQAYPLIDLANSIFVADLLETDDTSIPKIMMWLTSNVGILNSLLYTQYYIVGNDCSPHLGNDEAAIFAVIYLERYYARQVQMNLGGAQYDWSEINEADSKIRRVSKNEIAKTYLQLKNQTSLYLKQLALDFRRNRCVSASIQSEFFTSVLYQKTLQQPGSNDANQGGGDVTGGSAYPDAPAGS